MIIIGSILGGTILIIFLCCLCNGCGCDRDHTKSPDKNDIYQKNSKLIIVIY